MRLASFVFCSGPAWWLGGAYFCGGLGVNPLNTLLHVSGRSALTLLMVTLAVTPVRRLSVFLSQTAHARYGKRVSDWNWLIRLRRQFGLFTFFYACVHLAVYIGFDTGPALRALFDDARQRPFIIVGWLAFFLLVPLAVSSNKLAMKWLGGAWRKLHTLTYPIAALALAHFWIQTKVGDSSPLPYSLGLGVLLATRVEGWLKGERASAVEVAERQR